MSAMTLVFCIDEWWHGSVAIGDVGFPSTTRRIFSESGLAMEYLQAVYGRWDRVGSRTYQCPTEKRLFVSMRSKMLDKDVSEPYYKEMIYDSDNNLD